MESVEIAAVGPRGQDGSAVWDWELLGGRRAVGNGGKRTALSYVWFSFKLQAILFVVGAAVKQQENVCKKKKNLNA